MKQDGALYKLMLELIKKYERKKNRIGTNKIYRDKKKKWLSDKVNLIEQNHKKKYNNFF